MKKGNKILGIILDCFFLLVLIGGTCVAYYFAESIWGESSVFNKSISETAIIDTLYHKIPTLIRTVQIITIAIVLNLILKLLQKFQFGLSKKSKTLFDMINNLLRWIVTIVAVFVILSSWGVNTTTLVSGASILALVVGLASQSLIADIVAGLFIIIEGNIMVDDIVVIDSWRGRIKEIGIRTIKIEDVGGDIKVINNSEIKSVINQTTQKSLATCKVCVASSQNLKQIEELLNSNLNKIKEQIPAIIDNITYKGLAKITENHMEFLFNAKCEEEYIYQVERDLTRQFKLLLDENSILCFEPSSIITKAK